MLGRLLNVLLAALLLSGCAAASKDTVTQVSTITALLAGDYDGRMTCGELLRHGDFGIGTFDRLDGEMIVLDGTVYQAKADGRAAKPDGAIPTPFAVVCGFSPDQTLSLSGADFKAACELIDKAVPRQDGFCAVKIEGAFSKIRVRSAPAQTKPYLPLAEALTRYQSVHDLENVSGTIVGFRFPPYMKGVNVTGYHFHFISGDRMKGGHVLDFTLPQGKCLVHVCDRFLMIVPENPKQTQDLDLSTDRTGELEKVE
jgi:acetolactate decarboxylase